MLELFEERLLWQEECDFKFKQFGESSRIGNINTERWIPQLTTDVLFCADANLNDKAGVCKGDSGGAAIQRYIQLKAFIYKAYSYQYKVIKF